MATTLTLGGDTQNINEIIRLDKNNVVKAYGKTGNDTYIITNNQTKNATISDILGQNTVILTDGLSIIKSTFSSSKLTLKLNNGSTINVLSPNKFNYKIGDNALAINYATLKNEIGTTNYLVKSTSLNLNADTDLSISTNAQQTNTENKAPFIYLSSNINQVDSITTLLNYTPDVKNNINYQDYQTEAWRDRASSSSLAIDLTQTSALSNSLNLTGMLDNLSESERWYKINLTQTSTIQIQDISNVENRALVEAVIFKNPNGQSLTYYYSNYDPQNQLTTYNNLPAGDYYIRVSKDSDQSNHKNFNNISDYNFMINTHPQDSFVLPTMNYNGSNVLATLPANQNKIYYQFSLNQNAKIAFDMTNLSSQYEFALFKQSANGLIGSNYTYSSNAPEKFIYSLTSGNYILRVTASKISTKDTQISVPLIIQDNLLGFNPQAVVSNAPKILKADLSQAKSAIQHDSENNLVLTYSFDLNPIVNSVDAQPSPTAFSDLQKQSTREILKDYENIAKLKFVELPNGSSQSANIYFVNVAHLGGSAGEASNDISNENDLANSIVKISRATKTVHNF